MSLPRIILVPTDFSDPADHALDYAIELAAALDATIQLLHVIGVPVLGIAEIGMAYAATAMEQQAVAAQGELDARVARGRDRVAMAPTRMETGDAREVIDQVASTAGADLIVMATHGRRGVTRMLLGSVAESVARTAPCPVLVVRARY
jgi:nucleotide-binding universal stress UspA family protein